MTPFHALEEYLREAPVIHIGPWPGGFGHQNKQLVVLGGGVRVLAKLSEGPPQAWDQIRAEVSAWHLACDLGWTDLVATTVLRNVRSYYSGNSVKASVQVVWPLFKTALDMTIHAEDCTKEDHWRVGVFDWLAFNSDRNESNWGYVDDLKSVKCVDHGEAFDPSRDTKSDFTDLCQGDLPTECFEAVSGLIRNWHHTRTHDKLGPGAQEAVWERAKKLESSRTIPSSHTEG